MDRERLKQIIVEEIQRAARELESAQVGPSHPPKTGTNVSMASTSTAPSSGRRAGLVLLSGRATPSSLFLDALDGIKVQGFSLQAVVSLTFRQFHPSLRELPGGMPVLSDADDEPRLEAAIKQSTFVLAPDLSLNSLNKVVLGIEDSVPTRVLASAMGAGKPCLLIECAETPLINPGGAARLDLIRRLRSRGVFDTTPSALLDTLRTALRSPEDDWFSPPAPKPAERRRVVTKEDVYEAAAKGVVKLIVPATSIITLEAYEDAGRRGMTIEREE